MSYCADLVILRHVRIEIILPVEFADLGDPAAEHQAGQDGHAQSRPRSSRAARRAGRGRPGRSASSRARHKLDGAAAKHFALRLELDVDFEADGGEITHVTEPRNVEEAPSPEQGTIVPRPARLGRRGGRLFRRRVEQRGIDIQLPEFRQHRRVVQELDQRSASAKALSSRVASPAWRFPDWRRAPENADRARLA